MSEHAVVIVGAGPTGMMLAAELKLAGVDALIVERRPSGELVGSRSGGLHSRTIEVLDQRGVADRFLTEGKTAQVATFSWIPLDISDFPTRHNYGLGLWQTDFERILLGWVNELGIEIVRGLEVRSCTQDNDGVDVEVSDGRTLRSAYLVGCDGGRSVVRKAADIEFIGWEPSISSLVAEVEFEDEPPLGVRRDDKGVHGLGRLADGCVRLVVSEGRVVSDGEPTLSDLRRALVDVYGTDYGVHGVRSLSRFTDAARQAASYRRGRMLLAGDAAHVHSPMGGQGLNIGIQDAVNLGWKLAQVVLGIAPDGLLDTFESERHPIGARVLQTSLAANALGRSTDRIEALRDVMSELLTMDEPRKRYAGQMSGLDVHYDLGVGHPLLGRRMPDLDLDLDLEGDVERVFDLLHDAKPVLLNFGDPGRFDIGQWKQRVLSADAHYEGRWELPVVGEVDAPDAVLIRPDGYVAWVGGDPSGLPAALTTWFGSPVES